MQSSNSFLVKFASSIIAALGCHDPVIFKGYLPFNDETHLNRFVDHTGEGRSPDERSQLCLLQGIPQRTPGCSIVMRKTCARRATVTDEDSRPISRNLVSEAPPSTLWLRPSAER
jgi:hypothetical protein